MNFEQRRSRALAAYHDGAYDGALWWFARRRMERRLRRSPALRRELDELAQLSDWVRELESASRSAGPLNSWSEIGPALSRIDAEIGAKGGGESSRSRDARDARDGWSWGALAGTLAVATLVFAVLNVNQATNNQATNNQATNNASIDAKDTLDNGAAIPEYAQVADRGSAGGSLRYLRTNGVSYAVSQDSEDVTIIWLMDALDTPEGA